jgi:hypothetical protein
MAVTISRYNHTVKKLLNKEIDYTTLKMMLLNNSATFTAADTTLDQVAGANTPPRANEVSGNGWTTGGIALASVAVTVVATNDAMIDADDISVTAAGGSIGPAYKAVIYDDTGDVPLWFIDFGQVEEAGETTDFKFSFNASGIFRAAD